MDTGGTREIQALDELGRWEAAKIIRELEDGKFLVRSIGWGREFDSEVPESKIRPAVHPFQNGVGKCLFVFNFAMNCKLNPPPKKKHQFFSRVRP